MSDRLPVSDPATPQRRSMRPLFQTMALDVAPPLIAYYGLRAAGASEYAALAPRPDHPLATEDAA